MANLLAVDSCVAAQYVEQQGSYPGAFSTEHIDGVDIANKDRLRRPGLCLCQGQLENTRIRLLYANQVRVNHHLEELFNPALPEDRSDAPVRVRHDSQGETALAQLSQYPRGRGQHHPPEIGLGVRSSESLNQ